MRNALSALRPVQTPASRPARAVRPSAASRSTPILVPGIAAIDTGPAARQRELRATWLATVDALRRRRADLVSESAIADYVALYWLEWSGGTLRPTALGDNISLQLRAGME